MSWSAGRPQDRWTLQDQAGYLREIYTRLSPFGAFTWNPPNVPANSTVDTTLTTTDAAVFEILRAGMAVSVSPPSTIEAGIVVGGVWVAADETLTIRLGNVTGLAVNPASGTWSFQGTVI